MRVRIQDFDYANTDITKLIDEYIHNVRNRAVLKLRFCDGLTYDEIASEMGLSYEQIKTIIYRGEQKIIPHLPMIHK